MKLATVLFSAITLLTPIASQHPTTAAAKKAFVLEAGEFMLPDLIDRCAAHLGWNVLSNAAELATAAAGGSTRLQHRIETDTVGCEELLGTMLYRSGFALTTLDEGKQLYEVINMSGPRVREITSRAQTRTVEQVLARPSLKVAVLVVFELKHTNATIATNSLRPFFASSGGASPGNSLTFGNVGNNSALLLCGMQEQVAGAIRLLRICDVPAAAGVGTSLDDRLDAIERRLGVLEQKLNPPQPPTQAK